MASYAGKIMAVSGDALDRLMQENVIRKALGELSFVELRDVEAMIVLDKSTASVTAASGTGHTVQLTATVLPEGSTVTWTSSASAKASVSNKGVVTGAAAGSATITASITVGGVTYSDVCNITVT